MNTALMTQDEMGFNGYARMSFQSVSTSGRRLKAAAIRSGEPRLRSRVGVHHPTAGAADKAKVSTALRAPVASCVLSRSCGTSPQIE